MAEEFLEELYRYADAVTTIETMIEFHRANAGTSNFKTQFPKLVQVFAEIAKKMILEQDIRGKELWETLQKIYEYTSFTPLLDDLEEKCIPIMREYINSRPKIDVNEGDLRFRSSTYGFLYLSDTNNEDEPFNSRINPMKEAYYIAKNIYHPSKYKYVFLGAGLGYIPYQLYLLTEGDVDIHVFYHDSESYEYATLFGVLDWIPKDILHVHVSNSINNFLVCATDNCDEYYFYLPDLRKYTEEENALVNVYVKSKNTERSIVHIENDNFYRNIRRTTQFVDDFDATNLSDKIVIVAGGPSVDDNIDFLRDASNNGISIICVGTVFKKLIQLNIMPDIVTACDPFLSVVSQFTELNISSVPLMIGLNTNWRVANEYKGEKYLVALGGIKGDTLRYVKNREKHIFPSSATVTSMAFNLAVYFGAKEIYLIGADYGFPGKMSHAEGTVYRKEVNKPDMKIIQGISGDLYSDDQMIAYKEEMEEYIAKNPEINVYNLSKNGALIKGAICI